MPRRFSFFGFLFSMVVVGALLAAPVFAQDAKPAPPAAPAAESVKSADKVSPPPVASAKFLASFDKFVTLGEARAEAEKKRAEYEGAVKVLDEQREALRRELLAQIPAGYTWDAGARAFVKLPEPPAKEKEKP